MRESVHRKLERVRAPRVHITYEVESGDAVESHELPFIIGVLGDFAGASPNRRRWPERAFRQIDVDNFDDVLAALQPRVHLGLADFDSDARLEIDLDFASMEDFEPEAVAQRIEPLRRLQQSNHPNERARLHRCLDRVLHAPEFQALEASWRALRYLILRAESGNDLKVLVIDVTKAELLRDLQRAPEFDHSILFKKVYEERYGILPRQPFGLFIGSYEFGPTGQDIELLDRLAAVARTCLTPFVAGGSPSMFGMEDFATLEEPYALGRFVDEPAPLPSSPPLPPGPTARARWQAFRESEDARYVGLVVPRILLRSPYGVRPGDDPEAQYVEDVSSRNNLLWGNAAYAFGATVSNAFARFGWCGAIHGVESGGAVEGLPTWEEPLEGGGHVRSFVEVVISDRREKELSDRGFIPLVQLKGSDLGAFFAVPSCARPRFYDSDAATTSSRLTCLLQYVLTASRFMHYVRVIAADRRGRDETRNELERHLNEWISGYVLSDDQASSALKARQPLREARIDIREHRPGAYHAVAFLRPHFQLDELTVSMRLVADLTLRKSSR